MLVGQQMLDVCIVTNVKQGASHVRSATKNVSAQRFRCKGRDVRSSQCCVHSLVFFPTKIFTTTFANFEAHVARSCMLVWCPAHQQPHALGLPRSEWHASRRGNGGPAASQYFAVGLFP